MHREGRCKEIAAAAKSLQSCPILCNPIAGVGAISTGAWVIILGNNSSSTIYEYMMHAHL